MLGGVKLYTLSDDNTLLDPTGSNGSLATSLAAISSFLHGRGKIATETDVKTMIEPHLVRQ